MIKNTTITFGKKDAAALVRMIDLAHSEVRKEKEERAQSFNWVDEDSINRVSAVAYQFQASRMESMVLTMTENSEED